MPEIGMQLRIRIESQIEAAAAAAGGQRPGA